MPLREGELTLYLPESDPVEFDLEAAQRAVFCLPGRLAVAPDRPRFSSGSLLLPDLAAVKERPDAGTVVCVGGPRRLPSGGWSSPIPLVPGDRVLLRPCKGKWLRDFETESGFSLPEIRFYGVTYDWSHEVLAVFSKAESGKRIADSSGAEPILFGGRRDCLACGIGGPSGPGSWEPLNDWLIIRRESNASFGGVLVANPGSKPKRHQALVVGCQPGVGVLPGQTVLVDDHPNVGLSFCYGDLAGCEMVKMVDEDGYRQVFAVYD